MEQDQTAPRGASAGSPPLRGHVPPAGAADRARVRPAEVVAFPGRLLMRALFPRLVDRYVVGELMGPLLFGWTMFIVLFVFSIWLFKLAQMAARGASLGLVGELLWLRVVLSSVYCLPMAALLSGLMAFGRLSGDSELIAMQAGGIPNRRLFRNVLVIGLVLSLAGLALNEFVLPAAGKRALDIENLIKVQLKGQVADLLENRPFTIQDMENGRLARLVVAKKYEDEEQNPYRPARLTDVTYVQYDDKGNWATIIQAARAEFMGGQKWRFVDAETQFRFQVMDRRPLSWRSDETSVTLRKTPRQVAEDQKRADQMSYRELKDYIESLDGRGRNKVVRELRVELERKLAVPFAALVLAMVGAPMGVRRQRSTAGAGIGLSLIIIILYYLGMGFLGVLGENGQISPLAAAWGCNLAGVALGAFLIVRSSA